MLYKRKKKKVREEGKKKKKGMNVSKNSANIKVVEL